MLEAARASEETQREAATILAKAGIRGERGLATQESSPADLTAGEVIADFIPGVDLLRGKSRRIVVVSDQRVYLFEGRKFGRVGAPLASFETAQDVFGFDDRSLVFPDDTRVTMSRHQASELIAATGGRLSIVRANYALQRLGVEGEQGLGTASGIEPSTERTSVGGRIAPVLERISPVIDLTDVADALGKSKAESRLVLFSDKFVRVLEGQTIATMGSELAICPVGSTIAVDDDVVTFPGGQLVKFRTAAAARRVAETTRTGKD